jgi:hypothetical protein
VLGTCADYTRFLLNVHQEDEEEEVVAPRQRARGGGGRAGAHRQQQSAAAASTSGSRQRNGYMPASRREVGKGVIDLWQEEARE